MSWSASRTPTPTPAHTRGKRPEHPRNPEVWRIPGKNPIHRDFPIPEYGRFRPKTAYAGIIPEYAKFPGETGGPPILGDFGGPRGNPRVWRARRGRRGVVCRLAQDAEGPTVAARG